MKTDIEYAALPTGRRCLITGDAKVARIQLDPPHDLAIECWGFWRPLHDDGDSRRLEAACRNWIARMIRMAVDNGCDAEIPYEIWEARDALDTLYESTEADVTAEQHCAAVLALAVAIGKVMEGNDNAG